jgi:hypothetical protein
MDFFDLPWPFPLGSSNRISFGHTENGGGLPSPTGLFDSYPQEIWRLRAPSPPAWLTVYTADSSSNLTTNSTSENILTAEGKE